MRLLQRLAATALTIIGLMATAGCTTTSMMMSAVGVATDSSIPWSIVKHLHGKITEGDPLPCAQLNTVQRATSTRCGEFVRGSLLAADVASSGLQECPLIVAAQDPRLWPVLPELLNKGAQPESCWQSPLVRLAQVNACPDFSKASAEVLRSFEWLAEADARAIRHDTVRMLSCPSARMAGLNRVLDKWLASGDLRPENLDFSPLSALHPDYLVSPFSRELEAGGHTAQAGLGSYQGKLPPGFEEALRTSNWAALDWWLTRLPKLANDVPPTQSNQLRWLPLARVLIPTFLEHPENQRESIEFLMAHGADPWQRLPFDSSQTVVKYAKWLKSPNVALLESPTKGTGQPPVVASTAVPARGVTGSASE